MGLVYKAGFGRAELWLATFSQEQGFCTGISASHERIQQLGDTAAKKTSVEK